MASLRSVLNSWPISPSLPPPISPPSRARSLRSASCSAVPSASRTGASASPSRNPHSRVLPLPCPLPAPSCTMRLRPATFMRISITYLYVIFEYGYPHSMRDVLAALPKIRKLGFRFLEMEGLGGAHFPPLYPHPTHLPSPPAPTHLA